MDIYRETEDGLKRQVWKFALFTEFSYSNTVHLVLKEYRVQVRPTKRHGWRDEALYRHIDTRENTIKDVNSVPIPEDVKKEAIAKVEITVTKEMPR